MQPKTPSELEAVGARFYDFYDGLVRSVSLQYEPGGRPTAVLVVATRDAQAVDNDGWVSVRIVVRNVSEFGVREGPRTTIQVLTQGIHLTRLNDRIAVEFGGAIDPPDSLEALRQSEGYVVGAEIELQVGPY